MSDPSVSPACTHDPGQYVTGVEGTSYCPACEAAAVSPAEPRDDRVTVLEKALTQAIQVIEWCGLNDRTPTYEYGETRRDGSKPAVGAKFNTPREFASWWPDRLREVLDG